ncbi:MAG: hypothetical protein ACLSVS_09140, partial [Parasutterella excrementihominis]
LKAEIKHHQGPHCAGLIFCWPIQKLQTTRFDKMQKPNSVEHGGNGIGKLLVTFPVCEETKQNGSRIAVRSRL